MLRGGRVLTIAAAVAVGAMPLGAAMAAATPKEATATWYAGAAAESITPRTYDAARDAAEFPLCDTSVFNGPRHFDGEEPYIDEAGTGLFDYTQDPYCDANHNGRHDELYSSGGVDHIVEWVHDDIWVRALALSDGVKTIVIESITSQGLMNEDIDRIRAGLAGYAPGNGLPAVDELFASSTHNESSPDPIGIYGAPDDGTGSAGVYSGIDDYYIDYLVAQAIKAGKEAADALVPATMQAGEIHSATVTPRLSSTFPTTDSLRTGNHDDTSAATDTKLRILQLRALDGSNIETILNVAAHNQQVGHAGDDQLSGGKRVNRAISDDWPGVFADTVQRQLGGHAMFIVGDNGSIEDPHPTTGANLCPGDKSEGCFELPDYTGGHWGDDVVHAIDTGELQPVSPHAISYARDTFDVPLRNQLFLAAFAGGLFAHRHMAADGAAQGIAGAAMQTEVGLIDLGPDVQLLVNPGEAYPALIDGQPWGEDEVPCPGRPEPTVHGVAAVPAWHSTARFHFEIGLGDDMIGYLIPGPSWFADPAVYADPTCADPPDSLAADPTSDVDPNGHYHKLESESVGPEAGTLVAQHLSALADAAGAADGRVIAPGRFLLADGTQSRRAAGAVGMVQAGTVVALAGYQQIGTFRVDRTGQFIDFDGRTQDAPDIDTRGMVAGGTRYFVDPYPAFTGEPSTDVPEMRPLLGGLSAVVVIGAILLRRRRAT